MSNKAYRIDKTSLAYPIYNDGRFSLKGEYSPETRAFGYAKLVVSMNDSPDVISNLLTKAIFPKDSLKYWGKNDKRHFELPDKATLAVSDESWKAVTKLGRKSQLEITRFHIGVSETEKLFQDYLMVQQRCQATHWPAIPNLEDVNIALTRYASEVAEFSI